MKMNRVIKYALMVLLLGGLIFSTKDAVPKKPPTGGEPVLLDYTAYPPFVVGSSEKPNVMIIFSNDHTNFYKGYNDTIDIDDDDIVDTTYKDSLEGGYYGYFDPDKCYDYSGGTFNPIGSVDIVGTDHYCLNSSGSWSGNFLNWATMSHADFVRKALSGGKRVTDSANKTTLIRGNIHNLAHSWNKVYEGTDISRLTPFSSTTTFRSRGTSLYIRSGSYPSINCNDSDNWTYPDAATDSDTGAVCDSTTAPSNSYTVEVGVCNNSIGLEPNCKTYQEVGVTTYKPAGLIVRYAESIRFGLMTYSVDSYTDQGGVLRRNVQDVVNEINPNGTINSGIADSIIRYINNFSPKGWDPTAEMYYEAIRYYKALTPTSDSDAALSYRCGGGGPTDDGFPIYCNQSASRMWEDPIQSYCQGNYIIIVNDEYPSKDHDIIPGTSFGSFSPTDFTVDISTWTDTVGSVEGINGTSRDVGCVVGDCPIPNSCSLRTITGLGDSKGICPAEGWAEGSFYIAGLAYYAYTQDLRTGNCGTDSNGDPIPCTGNQTIKTYAIAYRASPGGYEIPPSPMNQLWLAAKYGGFEDMDGDGQPYTNSTCGTSTPNSYCSEWDEDGDGDPDNYFIAEKGADFEGALSSILADILRRESSGTSASILATTGEGEGAVYQAYFVPSKTSGANELTWLGYLHGLFIDIDGNIREDTDNNDTLNYTSDYIVQMEYNSTTNATEVNKYDDCGTSGNCDGVADTAELVEGSPFALSDVATIWEAGNVLWSTLPDDKTSKIQGYRFIKTSIQDTCISSTPCSTIDFTTANKATLRPYLRASDDNEAEAIIRYIRGQDTPLTIGGTTYNYRTRTMDIGGVSKTWKLGDIVYSTPTAVAKPAENYDLIYSDSTYGGFKTRYKNRRHVVYVGANDGMFHAFNAGVFNTSTHQYTGSGYTLGEELFAFIPQSLLPHLKWLTDTNYTHVYYVDLKPKVVDARIFTAEAVCSSIGINDSGCVHPYGWGTVLIGGMRFGGRDISYKDSVFGSQAKTFYSSYFALDITNPDATDGSYGKLLWVYTDTIGDLNMTTSYPAVLKTGTGTGTWHVVFGSGPTSYTGASTKSGKIYVLNLATGELARKFDDQTVLMDRAFMADPITIDIDLDYQVDVIYIGNTYCGTSGSGGCTSSTWKGKMFRISTGEYTDPASWEFPSILFDPQQPITSAPAAAMDEKANLWIFFGTGRFLSTYDKALDGTESWSFYGIKDTCKPWINSTCTDEILEADLFNASTVDVCLGGTTTGCSTDAQTWSSIITSAGSKDGWYIDFSPGGERALFKPLVLGGLSIWTTYTPSTDTCAFEGTSKIYATFYKTGTAYYEYVFTENIDGVVSRSADLGIGVPSSVGALVTGENTAMGFVQQSTGTIVQIEQITPFALKSGVSGWRTECY